METETTTSKYIKPFNIDKRIMKFVTNVDPENKLFYILPTTDVTVVEYIQENIFTDYTWRFDYITYFENEETVDIDNDNFTIYFKSDMGFLHYKSLTNPTLSRYKDYKKIIIGEIQASFLKDINNIIEVGLVDLSLYSWKEFKQHVDKEETWKNLNSIDNIILTNTLEQIQIKDIILEKYPRCKVKILYR